MSNSGEQAGLDEYRRFDFDYTPQELPQQYPSEAGRELAAWGLDASWLGSEGLEVLEDIPEDVEFRRYQFDRLYFYPVSRGDESELAPIEFRTYVNYVGQVPADLKSHIREMSNPHLQTMFNSGPYESWLTNFNVVEHASNVEDEIIGADEATALGVPQFEVIFKKNGSVQGEANGFFDPFEVRTYTEQVTPEAPNEEVWNLSYNSARGDYQISPPGRTRSRQRSKNIHGKQVYVNDHPVGSITQDGRAWLAKSYQSSDQTYRGNWSREKLVAETAATYSAIRDGGNLYKVRETPNAVYLVTARAKPDDFNPRDPDAVDPSATEEAVSSVTLALSDSTEFFVRSDTGSLAGKYSSGRTRSIDTRTTTGTFGTVPEGSYQPD